MPTVTIIGSHLSTQVEVRCSQDTVGNRTTLRIVSIKLRNEWGDIGTAYVTGTVSINGSRAAKMGLSDTYGCSVGFSAGRWCSVGLGHASLSSVTVSHNSDGTCSPVKISVSLSADRADGSYDYGYISGSGTVSVPAIPRVSEISASGVVLGSEVSIQLSRASPAFLDTVSWQCGSESGVVAEKTGNTSLTWTPPVSLAAQNTQGTAVDVILTVTTYSGTTAIGSKSVTARCPIPDSIVPILSAQVDDKSGCLQKYGCFVRTRSQAVVKTAAAGAYGSTVKEITVSCGSLTGSGEEAVFSLPDPGMVPVRVTVTDSRGRTAFWETTVTVTDYQNPVASLTALSRCGADGALDPQGGYGKAVFTGSVTALGGKNSAVYRLKKRIRGTESWNVSEISAYTGMFSPQGEAVFSAGVDDDFEICVSASDDFTETAGAVTVLPVAFSLLDFHRGDKSVGILQRATTPRSVDIGGDTVHHGHRLRDVGAPQDPDDAVTLRTLLETVHPVGSIYMSTVETSPASLFGGTWERLKDRFLLAAGDAFPPLTAGGEAEHVLTTPEIANHVHTVRPRGVNTAKSDNTQMGSYPIYIRNDKIANWNVSTFTTDSAGGGQPHNNMPPYLAVYMWQRTA